LAASSENDRAADARRAASGWAEWLKGFILDFVAGDPLVVPI
jgi:hypothetical protein